MKSTLLMILLMYPISLTSAGTAMDLLEPHIKSGLGVSFKADNEKYLKVYISNGIHNIEASGTVKNLWSKFMIEKIDNNHVYLRVPHDGNRYVGLVIRDGVNHIQSYRTTPNPRYDKFRVYAKDGKIIFRDPYRRQFLSRVTRGRENIEAAKSGIDKHCLFKVETGSIVPVKEEIVNIEWGKFVVPKDINPTLLDTRTVENKLTYDATKTITFSETIKETQQTSWENSWGVTLGASYTSTVSASVGIASAEASLTISAEVRYDGNKAGNKGKTETVHLEDTTTITIPPTMKVKAYYLAKVDKNIMIPFTATIKRTSEVGTFMYKERGTWKGVMVFNSEIRTTEQKIDGSNNGICTCSSAPLKYSNELN